jgi:glycolate oxidase iron-sulfur subunit
MRVGIFVGCLINYVYPQIIDDTLHVLREAHIEAVIPPSQVCCGTPVLAFGDIEAARKLARRNVDSFRSAGCDYIITPCASCGRTLKHEYEQLLESPAPPLGAPALDVSEFLCEFGELTFERADGPVTYHDPCHLRWGQGVAAEPRKLLTQSSHFVEPSGEMTCCGLGGAFHVLYPEIAESIGRKKVESLSSLDIREVATGCPGCVLQLNDLFAKSHIDKKAVHTIEVLARSLGKKESP